MDSSVTRPVPSGYTQPAVLGIKHTRMLPGGCSLVLEGGGTRGFYSTGVFEAFMDAGIMFPYIVGVSAGAANALTYVAGQRGRNRTLVEHYVGKHQYLSYRNLIKHGSLFGYDYIFGTIPQKHLFWDKEVFVDTDIRFLTGVTDCRTGNAVWFEKRDVTDGFDVARASCSVPFCSKIVKYGGYDLLDGGVCAPIPIEKSIEDGNGFHVVVLTRNRGYVKKAFTHKSILRLFYGKYPRLAEAMLKRHEVYNAQVALCERLEREGKAIIIRPLEPLAVGRTGRDTGQLLKLYDEGHNEGKAAVRLILDKFMK